MSYYQRILEEIQRNRNRGAPRQRTNQENLREIQRMKRIFKSNFKLINKRLEDFLLAYLITKDIYADSEDIEEELEIDDIGQVYNVFENNYQNKSDAYKNFFRRDNGQVIQVKSLLNQQILPVVDSLKNENNEIIFEFFSNVLGDFKASYGTLPTYKQEIVTIGRSVLEKTNEKLKTILTTQQQQAMLRKQQAS